MDELGVKPTVSVVAMVGDVFQKLNMLDKYQKLMKKYPPPKKEYRYIQGKRVKIRSKPIDRSRYVRNPVINGDREALETLPESCENTDVTSNKPSDNLFEHGVAESPTIKHSQAIEPS